MDSISEPKFIEELSKKVHSKKKSFLDNSYQLLHTYTQENIIPKLIKQCLTVGIIELTTCGLISDLLTGKEGASKYFISSYIPYTNEAKIDLGLEKQSSDYNNHGIVSIETVKELAKLARQKANSEIGIAETGLLTSEVLSEKKTMKKAGLVFTAIADKQGIKGKKLEIDSTLSRILMRHNIAYEIMKFLSDYLDNLSD